MFLTRARRLANVLRPEIYHGREAQLPFFEGWYLKSVSSDLSEALVIIVGVIRSAKAELTHAFLQIFDGRRGDYRYLEFPVDSFWASASKMEVRLPGVEFNAEHIKVDIDRAECRVHGKITFGNLKPWPVTLTSPGAMGWYAWMPFMECYHGVVGMDHSLAGAITMDDRRYNFDGGRGYLEKDWGRSFPSSWIWYQSNHFGRPGISLVGSIARIPWIGRDFPGHLVGFLLDDRFFKFAVYTGSRTKKLEVSDDHIEWIVRDRKHELIVRARQGKTVPLRAPSLDGMTREVKEALDAELDVQLTRRGFRGGVVYEGHGAAAGLETHGDMTELGATKR